MFARQDQDHAGRWALLLVVVPAKRSPAPRRHLHQPASAINSASPAQRSTLSVGEQSGLRHAIPVQPPPRSPGNRSGYQVCMSGADEDGSMVLADAAAGGLRTGSGRRMNADGSQTRNRHWITVPVGMAAEQTFAENSGGRQTVDLGMLGGRRALRYRQAPSADSKTASVR